MSDTNVKPLSIIIKKRTKKMKLSDEYMAKMKTLASNVTYVSVISDMQRFRAITGKKENGVYDREFFPLTESGFEAAFKASKDYREKQDEERKRKANAPSGREPRNTTLIF